MIDLSRVRYDLVAITPDGTRWHLGDALEGLTWERQPGQLPVRATADLAQVQLRDGRWLHQLLPLGGRVEILADWGQGWQAVFAGEVIRVRPGNERGKAVVRMVAYDPSWRLRSKDDFYFPPGRRGRDVLREVFQKWNVPARVDGPDTAMPKLVYRATPLMDIVADVLRLARLRGGGKWVARWTGGRLEVVRPGGNQPVYRFGPESTTQVDYEASIEDLVTRVRIVGQAKGDEPRPAVATLDGRLEFGVLQEIVVQSRSDSDATARQEAQEILAERGRPQETRTLIAPDLPFLRVGDAVYLEVGPLIGYHYVVAVQHDADRREMTLEVDPL